MRPEAEKLAKAPKGMRSREFRDAITRASNVAIQGVITHAVQWNRREP